MQRAVLVGLLLLALALAAPACRRRGAEGPDHIVIQHVLIMKPGPNGNRGGAKTLEEAEKLAGEILARARAGEDFDALVKRYTDDSAPGIYRLANVGMPVNSAIQEAPRERMVKGFGDVGFSLEVGAIGMAAYDPATSPFGWHIIKRLE